MLAQLDYFAFEGFIAGLELLKSFFGAGHYQGLGRFSTRYVVLVLRE